MRLTVSFVCLVVHFSCIVVFLRSNHAVAGQYHVSPAGTTAGRGTSESPWDLRTALSQPPQVVPGDTLWLHGGTYYGSYTSALRGTPDKPIIVRTFPGEWARIDGGNSNGEAIFFVQGSYTWYWGFEVMSSDPGRISTQSTSWPTDIARGECVTVDQSDTTRGLKFINLVIHDGRQGFSSWMPDLGTELYGCIVYNNGWVGPDRPHGHNLYIQNSLGIKNIFNNVFFHPFSHNIQAYGTSTAHSDSIHCEGNISFAGGERNVLIGGGDTVHTPLLVSNVLYEPAGGSNLNLGWDPFGFGVVDAVVTNNMVLGGEVSFKDVLNSSIQGNTIFAKSLVGVTPELYPNNVWIAKRPQGVSVAVVRNAYEPGRAHIIAENWDLADQVSADLTGILEVGDRFTIQDAQNITGAPLVSGSYSGGMISIPVKGLTAAQPIGGGVTMTHTAPEFGVFELVSGSSLLGVQPRQELPAQYALNQNYPNPFNPSTTITYSLPGEADVQVRVYTMLGQPVATLAEGRQQAGEHHVVFAPKNAATGMYVYEMRAGGVRLVKKMLLLK